MASIGSLPFLVHTKVESSVLLNCTSDRRPRFSFFDYRPRKYLESTGSIGLVSGYSLVGFCNGVLGAYGRRKLWRNGPLKSIRKDSEESDSGDESEDALQTNTEKSKKILEMHRELLPQVLLDIT